MALDAQACAIRRDRSSTHRLGPRTERIALVLGPHSALAIDRDVRKPAAAWTRDHPEFLPNLLRRASDRYANGMPAGMTSDGAFYDGRAWSIDACWRLLPSLVSRSPRSRWQLAVRRIHTPSVVPTLA
jgi:hypothetical protein